MTQQLMDKALLMSIQSKPSVCAQLIQQDMQILDACKAALTELIRLNNYAYASDSSAQTALKSAIDILNGRV